MFPVFRSECFIPAEEIVPSPLADERNLKEDIALPVNTIRYKLPVRISVFINIIIQVKIEKQYV